VYKKVKNLEVYPHLVQLFNNGVFYNGYKLNFCGLLHQI